MVNVYTSTLYSSFQYWQGNPVSNLTATRAQIAAADAAGSIAGFLIGLRKYVLIPVAQAYGATIGAAWSAAVANGFE